MEKRDSLERMTWSADCISILGKLMHHPFYEQAETIYSYVSYNQEADTWSLIAFSLSIGKKVAVPKVIGKELKFFYIKSLEELKPGYKGIYEPITNAVADDESALMIMPIVAFDRERHRIGYGGGYYDRYLSKHTGHTKIGIAFGFQQVSRIPFEPFDINPDIIITEKREEKPSWQ